MRYILISPEHQAAFDCNVPLQLDELYIERVLQTELAKPLSIAPGVDLWLPTEPQSLMFTLAPFNEIFRGQGIVCGCSRLDEVKGLPRDFSLGSIRRRIGWISSSPVQLKQAA